MFVDAHAHVWKVDPLAYPWRPTFGFVPISDASPTDLLAAMDRHGVAHTILVQPSPYGPDHRFLLDTVAANPDRFLAVGLVDPGDPEEVEDAGRLVRDHGLVGLRINMSLDVSVAAVQAAAPGWARLEEIGVPICLRATPAHHHLVRDILGRSALRIVIDHLGLPDPTDLGGAIERLADLGGYERCWLKVAGLARASRIGPPFEDAWPLMKAALRSFGTARLTWGSDFPNDDLEAGYNVAVAAIEAMPFLTAADRDQVMAGTARELWGDPPAGLV